MTRRSRSTSRRQSWKWYLGALNVLREIPKSRDKVVLVLLASYANNQGTMFPSQISLALASGYSDRAVRQSLRRLKEQGLISFSREKGFKNRVNLYRLLFAPYDRQPGHFSDHEKNVEPAELPLEDQADRSYVASETGTPDPMPSPIEEQRGQLRGSVDPVCISERKKKETDERIERQSASLLEGGLGEVGKPEEQYECTPDWQADFLLSHKFNIRNKTKSWKVCNFCLGSDWYVRADGGMACKRCHPAPTVMHENRQTSGSI
jgi:DNA-binding transcriptional ArsR family regulator